MITSLWGWLTDPESWQGPAGIPTRLVEHLQYSLIVVLLAALIAIPAGLWIGHTGRARWLITVANSLRAVPTLGLLFAATLLIGPLIKSELAFTLPSIAVLVLLAIPPILAGTYAGIEAVDPDVRDAAEGIGLRGRQVLWQVEVPVGASLILSGLRSAVLQVVATATIAAYVGLGGLGRYLIDGIALRDIGQAAGGAVLVAVLAVSLDGLLSLAQRAARPGGFSSEFLARWRTRELARASVTA